MLEEKRSLRLAPSFGGLRAHAHCLSYAHWKARSGFPIHASLGLIEFFVVLRLRRYERIWIGNLRF